MQKATTQNLLHSAHHTRPHNLAPTASLLPSHAMIVSQHLGLPPKAAELLTNILQGTEYL